MEIEFKLYQLLNITSGENYFEQIHQFEKNKLKLIDSNALQWKSMGQV